MKTFKTGVAVSNMAIKSCSGSGSARHIFNNWLADNISAEEKQYREQNKAKNLLLPTKSVASFEQTKAEIEKIRNSIDTKRQRFETKEVVCSFPINEGMTDAQIKQIGIDLAKKQLEFLRSKFPKLRFLVGQIHLNEAGKPHFHLLFENTWIDKNNKRRFGWYGGSISKKKINEIQRDWEPIYRSTLAKYNIQSISQQENKKRHKRNGKKLSISEFKKIMEIEDQAKAQGSASGQTFTQEQFDKWYQENNIDAALDFYDKYGECEPEIKKHLKYLAERFPRVAKKLGK